jgi:hypothetical protein
MASAHDDAMTEKQQAASDAARHQSLHSVESRWVLPLAGLGLVGVIIMAWYGVAIANTRVERDGKLTLREADYLVRSGALVGLSLEEAQPLVEGAIVARSRGEAGTEVPVVAISDRDGMHLVMELREGRVAAAEVARSDDAAGGRMNSTTRPEKP